MVRERLAADEAARADAERQRRALEQEQADRVAVCARVEGLHGDDIADGVAQARATWEGMPPMPEAWAAELDRRFARSVPRRREALRAAPAGEAVGRAAADARARDRGARRPIPSYTDIRSQWYALRKQWQAIARDVEIDAELKTRYDAAAQKLEAQEQTHRDAKGAAADREPAAAAGAGAEVRDPRRRPKASRSSRPISC